MQDPTKPKEQLRYRLEISGPLLPSNCIRLMEVVRRMHGNASVAFSTIEESSPFNCVPCKGIHELCHEEELGKKALREMEWIENAEGFHWVSY